MSVETKLLPCGKWRKMVPHRQSSTGAWIPMLPRRQKASVQEACREIIGPQIAQFRKCADLSQRCPLSNKPLRSGKTHVDHVYPFSKLLIDWAKQERVYLSGVTVTRSRALGRPTMGRYLDESWLRYHEKHAKLQLVLALANLSKGSKIVL